MRSRQTRQPSARAGHQARGESPPARRITRVLRPSSEAGDTLIEVLVAALIVALIGIAVAQALIGSSVASADQRSRAQAAELAQADQARLDGLSSTELNGLDQTRTVTLDSRNFTVVSTAQFINSSGSSSCGTSGGAAYYQTTSSVTWPGNLRSAVVAQSLVTPAAGGTLLTQVDDQTGAGLPGATVTATGPDYATGVTGSGGCTVFPDLITGSFTVKVIDSGYVDANGNSASSGLSYSSTVTSTGVSNPSTSPVVIGQAGSVTGNFSTVAYNSSGALSTLSGQEADTLSDYGSGSSASMSAFQTNGTAGTLATTLPSSGSLALFPFYFTSSPNYSNNYAVWAGDCRQTEPPSGVDQFSVSPGSSQTLTVQEPALAVFVDNSGGTRITPSDVKLSFASTSGIACSDSWYAPVNTGTGSTSSNGSLLYPGQPFASTATSGSTESASGETGAYTVCADLKSGSNYYKVSTATGAVQNNNLSAPTSVTLTLPSTTSSSRC